MEYFGHFIAHFKGKRPTLATETPTTHRPSQGLLLNIVLTCDTILYPYTVDNLWGSDTPPHLPIWVNAPPMGRYLTPDDALTLLG